MVTLIFDRESTYLGELATKNGVLRHAILTQVGERELDAHLLHWQTRGVPVFQGIAQSEPDGTRQFVMYREFISSRDERFLRSAHRWLLDHTFQAYDVEDEIMMLWEQVLRLPLEATERFQFFLAFKNTQSSQRKLWHSLFDAAEQAVQAEREKTKQVIAKLKSTVSKHLLHVFEQSNAV